MSQKENLDLRCRSQPTAAPGLLVVVIWPNLCFAKSVGPKSVCSDLAGFLASVLTERLLLHPMTKYLRAQIELNIYWGVSVWSGGWILDSSLDCKMWSKCGSVATVELLRK